MAEFKLLSTEGLKEILSNCLLACPLSVIITDHTQPDEPIVFVNHAFERLTGFSSEEVLGLNPRFLHGDEADQPGLEIIGRSLREGRSCVSVIRDYRKDKTPIWVQAHITPVRNANGKITHFMGVQHDISTNIELEEERNTFIASLAHDIKSPSIGADRLLELILERSGSSLEPGLHEALVQLQNNNKRVLALVMNVLEEYRHLGAAQQLNFDTVNLSELISSCVAEITPIAAEQNVTIRTDCPRNDTWYACDRQAMSRLIVNLLDNAVKFNKAGGLVDVSLSSVNGAVTFVVADTGSGIPNAQMSGLFTKFKRLQGGRKAPGCGLGLYICRKIVESHNGRIICDSEPNNGTRFTVVLPRESGI